MRKQKRDRLTELAQAAFDAAAHTVLERARRFGTPVIVWQDGQIKALPSDQVELKTIRRNGRKTVVLVEKKSPA